MRPSAEQQAGPAKAPRAEPSVHGVAEACPPAGWLPMLRAIPRRNEAAQAADSEGDAVRVRVRQRRPAYLRPPLSWIVPFREEREHRLDALGSEVWRSCDGHRDVEAVIDVFADRYALSFHEARVAVTGYLRLLVQRGILALELGTQGTTEAAS